MRCHQCDNELSQNAKYCSRCGASQQITRELIDRAIRKDEKAITELYNRTYNAVYYTAHSLIKDEDTVMDIVQDSYIKGFQSLNTLDKPENYKAWMKRIAVNKAKDWLKKKKPVLFSEMESDESEQIIDFPDERKENLPEEVIDRNETTRLLNEMLDSLSEDQRIIISLFYYEQLSIKEIANILDIPENTIKSRLNYARKKIETQVIELEKKGTKLYGLAPVPFLLFLFKNMEAQAAQLPSQTIFQNIVSELSIYTSSQIAGANATAHIIGNTTATAISGTITKTIAGKVIAAIASITIIGGSVAGVVAHNKNQESKQTAAIIETASIPVTETETEPPSEKESEKHTEYQTESEPEETSKELILDLAYQEAIDEYIAACSIDDEAYLADSQSYENQYTNVNTTIMLYYHRYETQNFYYAYHDINNDGQNELLIANGDAGYISIVDIYTFNGENAVKAIDNDSLGDRSSLTICTDGTMIERNSSGAASGSYCFLKISNDHYTIETEIEYQYNYTDYPDKPYYTNNESLTEDEFNTLLTSHTESTDFNWELLSTKQVSLSDSFEGKYQNIETGKALEIKKDGDEYQATWERDSGNVTYIATENGDTLIVTIILPSSTPTLTLTKENDNLIITGDTIYEEHVYGDRLDGTYTKTYLTN